MYAANLLSFLAVNVCNSVPVPFLGCKNMVMNSPRFFSDPEAAKLLTQVKMLLDARAPAGTPTTRDLTVTADVQQPPNADVLQQYARRQAGRYVLRVNDSTGWLGAVQSALAEKSVALWLPGVGTTAAINFGTSFTARATGTSAAQSHPNRSYASALSATARALFGTGTTATGACGIQSTQTVACIGDSSGWGGFYFLARFGMETALSNARAFIGLSANNAAMAANPSTWNNTIGLSLDAGQTNWQFLARDTAALGTDTGGYVSAGDVLEFSMFSPPDGSSVTGRLVYADTGSVIMEDTVLTTNLPAAGQFLYMQAHIQSTTGTSAKSLALNKMYLETLL